MFGCVDGAEVARSGRLDLDLREPQPELRFGGAQQRGVRRNADRQQHAALGAALLGRRHRALDRLRAAGDDDLAGSVVVDGLDDFALRRFLAARLDGGIIEPENGRHRALARRHRRLHEAAAFTHQRQRGTEAQRAGADQGRVFTQAVARDHGRCRAAPLLPHPPGRNARRQHRRLRALGAVQVLGRARGRERPQVVAQRVGGFFIGLPHDAVLRGELAEHAHGLGTLTGKYERQCHRHAPPENRREL